MVITNEMRRPKALPKNPKTSINASNKKQSGRSTEVGECSSSSIPDPEKFNGADLTMTQLYDIIKKLSAEVCKSKIDEEISEQERNTQDQLKKLTKDVQNLRDGLETLQQKYAKQQRMVERLQYENTSLKAEVKKVCLKSDKLEQEKFKNSVQIVGLPDSESEDDMKQVLKITKEKLGVKIKANDIIAMSRLGKKRAGKTRHLNVTFKETATREKVFQQRKKLIIEKAPSRSIYINDCLTKHRQNVLYLCRKQVRAKKLFAAWSQGGNVLIRRKEDGEVIQVFDHGDLREMSADVETKGSLVENSAENMSMLTSDESSIVTHLSNYSFEYSSDI